MTIDYSRAKDRLRRNDREEEMRFKRLLLLTVAALTAIAFAAPSAQADVELTESDTPLEVGALVTATSPNLVTTTALGTAECELVRWHLEVTSNGPTHVTFQPLQGLEFQGCAFFAPEFELPVTVTDSTALETLTINTWGTGETNTTFISEVYSPSDPGHTSPILVCHFEGGLHAQARVSGGETFDLGPSVLAGEGPGCTQEIVIEGTFSLETADGTPLELDFVETE